MGDGIHPAGHAPTREFDLGGPGRVKPATHVADLVGPLLERQHPPAGEGAEKVRPRQAVPRDAGPQKLQQHVDFGCWIVGLRAVALVGLGRRSRRESRQVDEVLGGVLVPHVEERGLPLLH